MSRLIVTVPAFVSKIATMADKSLRLQFDTARELPPGEEGKIWELRHEHGTLAFANAPLSDDELLNLPEYKPSELSDKTPGQRQRNLLYRIWEYEGGKGNFDAFYIAEMELIRQHLKETRLP